MHKNQIKGWNELFKTTGSASIFTNKWGGYVQFPGPVEVSEPHSNCDELCRLCAFVADVLESLINSMPGDVVQHARQLEEADTYLCQGDVYLNDVYDELNRVMDCIGPHKRAEWMGSCFDTLIQSDKSNKHPDKVAAVTKLMSNVDTLVNILCDDLQEGNDDQGTKERVMNMLKMVILNEFFPFFPCGTSEFSSPAIDYEWVTASRLFFLSQGKLNVDTAVVYANMFAYCKENIGHVFIDFDIEHDVEEKLSDQVATINDMKLFSVAAQCLQSNSLF